MAFQEWIFVTAIIIIILSFIISGMILRRKRLAVSAPLERIIPGMIRTEGLDVPVLETYAGLKQLAPITFVQNNLNPNLILFDDHFEYKVLRRKSTRYSEIESVHSFMSRYTNKLRFNFMNTGMFLMVVFANAGTHASVVEFLASKGIYSLSGS